MLIESNIPEHLLPKARIWFNNQMQALQRQHGAKFNEHRTWLAEYLNEELRVHALREVKHGAH